MAFHNRVRLPIFISRPQYSSTREQYVKANGDTVNLSSVMKKIFIGATEWITAGDHEKLMAALNHDNVVIEGEKYFGGVALDGEYAIDWADRPFEVPVAGAKFQITVTPYDNSNSNCLSCDQATQLMLVDDTFGSNLAEDTSYTLNVIQNDDICCYSVEFTITSFNTDYLSSATIDQTGVIHIHTKTPLVSANGINLLTYRATCGNGGFDEADVFANITGSISSCLAPLDLVITGTTNTGFHAAWTAPSPVPDHYRYQVLSLPGLAVLQDGDDPTIFKDITGLTANTQYRFQVRSQCDATDSDLTASNWIIQDLITTPVAHNSCGYYRVFPIVGPSLIHIVYLGCGGIYQTIDTNLLTPVNICALQSGDGAYLDIHSNWTGGTITWLNSTSCG